MKKISIILSLLSCSFLFSQRTEVQRKIDSISQVKWTRLQPNLDSLANPEPEIIELDVKDTLVIRDKVIVPKEPQDLPVTPYNLLNYPQEKNWFVFGQNSLYFNQASFSNWVAGGNNNMGVLGKVNYNISYKKGKHYLENLIQLGYGFVNADGQGTRKTEDYINIATNYGYDLGRNVYLSAGYQLLTQFTPGFNYTNTPEPTYDDRVSRFMAPGYLNLGLGISFNPQENFQVIFRPASGKFTFVLDPKLQTEGRYGLERDGQKVRTELGAMVNFLYRINIYKDMSLTNQLNFFSNYLSHFERVDVNYTGTLNLKFNRFISAIVALDILYDHDQIQKTQLKQTLGIGFSYNLGEGNQPKGNKRMIKPFVN